MVLVTGPTGSGKTTTLYACLSEIQSVEDKIVTIEDPVEYQLRGITQIPVNEKKGLTFARGLRSILRHDPDKVMVGEIRDEETAQIAVQAALTGHLVFTTVHANNVVDVLGRFLNMKVELYNFVSALNCVLAQRLVRKICPHCKTPMEPTKQLLDESGLTAAEVAGVDVLRGAGLHRVQRHRLLRPDGDHRAPRPLRPDPGPHPRPPARGRDQEGGQGGGDGLPPRVGAPEGLPRGDDAEGDQQGDLCRLTASSPAPARALKRSWGFRRPPHAFVLTGDRLVHVALPRGARAAPAGRRGEGLLAGAPARDVPRGASRAPRSPGPGSARRSRPLLPPKERVTAASLAVPDGFVKVAAVDVEPAAAKNPRELAEVLRWKVGRLYGEPAPALRVSWCAVGTGPRRRDPLPRPRPRRRRRSPRARRPSPRTESGSERSSRRRSPSRRSPPTRSRGRASSSSPTVRTSRPSSSRTGPSGSSGRASTAADPEQALQEIRLAASFVGGAPADGPGLDVHGAAVVVPESSPVSVAIPRVPGARTAAVSPSRSWRRSQARGFPARGEDPALLVGLGLLAGEE